MKSIRAMKKISLLCHICFCLLLFGSGVFQVQAQDDSLGRSLMGKFAAGTEYLFVRNCLKEIAIDPSSLSTRNFVKVDRDNWVGEVNWRNTFGGMTGWTPYTVRWNTQLKLFVVSVGGEVRYCNLPIGGR